MNERLACLAAMLLLMGAANVLAAPAPEARPAHPPADAQAPSGTPGERQENPAGPTAASAGQISSGAAVSPFEAYGDLFGSAYQKPAPARQGDAAITWLPSPLAVPPELPQQAGPGIVVERAAPLADRPTLGGGTAPLTVLRTLPETGDLEIAPDPAPTSASPLPGDDDGEPRPADSGDASGRPPAAERSLAHHAYGAFQRGFYDTARQLALKAAETGDPAAETLLGLLYEEGTGPPQDFRTAAGWYALAAEDGNPAAINRLGVMFLHGRGVAEDIGRAADLFERAADLGQPEAAHNIALLYLRGEVRPRDLQKARHYMTVAAEGGNPEAQYALGVMYDTGRGTLPDPEAATKWLRRAAEAGNPAAIIEYAIRLFQGEGTAPDQEKAAQLFRRAALDGNPIAMNRYARLLAVGRGVEMNEIEAAKWHLLARERGVSDLWLDGFVGTREEFVLKEARRRAEALPN